MSRGPSFSVRFCMQLDALPFFADTLSCTALAKGVLRGPISSFVSDPQAVHNAPHDCFGLRVLTSISITPLVDRSSVCVASCPVPPVAAGALPPTSSTVRVNGGGPLARIPTPESLQEDRRLTTETRPQVVVVSTKTSFMNRESLLYLNTFSSCLRRLQPQWRSHTLLQ